MTTSTSTIAARAVATTCRRRDHAGFAEPASALDARRHQLRTHHRLRRLGVPAPLIRSSPRDVDRFPIQSATLPDSLVGHDVLGRGKTGSGKTIAFALAGRCAARSQPTADRNPGQATRPHPRADPRAGQPGHDSR